MVSLDSSPYPLSTQLVTSLYITTNHKPLGALEENYKKRITRSGSCYPGFELQYTYILSYTSVIVASQVKHESTPVVDIMFSVHQLHAAA